MEIIAPYYEIVDKVDQGEILTKLEKCGRIAYKSEDKITPGSAEKFIRAIRERGHESVIEHVNLTIKFVCDRGVTHEIVRHRLVAYTQESTRYCNYAKRGVTFIKPMFWDELDPEYIGWREAMLDAEATYNGLIAGGASPQEARSVLPNSLKTEIVCTANLREWRHILKLRTSKAAHPQMREIMVPLLKELKCLLPVIFEDIPIEE
ncbi:MAG: FAD-dependent thymidylate synthase [Dehalococcoidales bacterium]|nr:FAD-dependent thymidylate synthase [Dehalococcoidales bacterium]